MEGTKKRADEMGLDKRGVFTKISAK